VRPWKGEEEGRKEDREGGRTERGRERDAKPGGVCLYSQLLGRLTQKDPLSLRARGQPGQHRDPIPLPLKNEKKTPSNPPSPSSAVNIRLAYLV
jgi:hypothetical protein